MRTLTAWLFACLAVAGCATMGPPAEQALEQARASFQASQSDPQVVKFAAAELDQARRELNEAERLWKQGSGNDKVASQAHMAQQRSRIARELAIARAGEAELQSATERRNQAMMEARVREAEQKRQEAEALARESQAKLDASEKARTAQTEQIEKRNAQAQRLESQLSALQAKQTDRGWVLSLGSEMFEPAGPSLRAEGRRAVNQLAQLLHQHSGRNVVVEGFNDASAGESTSRWLSERRAQAVRDWLVVGGIDPSRITARGVAFSHPMARVDVVIPGDEATARSATGGATGR